MKIKKIILTVFLTICLSFTFMLTACNKNDDNSPETPSNKQEVSVNPTESNVLIAYFSWSGTRQDSHSTFRQSFPVQRCIG